MRFQIISTIALAAIFASSVNCGCDRSGEVKPSEDGDVTQFFKNLGCDIKKGAEKVSDSAKPYIDDIKKGAEKVSESAKPYIDDLGSRARKLGGTVADRFHDLKEKISSNTDNSTVTPEKSSSTTAEGRSVDYELSSTSNSSSPSSGSSSSTPTTPSPSSSSSSILPDIDDRFILDAVPKCGENKKDDGRGHCRNTG
ncbi:uncharacterized protein LOC129945373 [Eupeodes corollae]|uniref:uncharacterized protein LOC129945373 n=1 Tax=Eupeodes corollae TaxID=290404 RepID=UPI00249114B9|nr:uncharacterized protein LOC129945373 [Eupeodes corollae]